MDQREINFIVREKMFAEMIVERDANIIDLIQKNNALSQALNALTRQMQEEKEQGQEGKVPLKIVRKDGGQGPPEFPGAPAPGPPGEGEGK